MAKSKNNSSTAILSISCFMAVVVVTLITLYFIYIYPKQTESPTKTNKPVGTPVAQAPAPSPRPVPAPAPAPPPSPLPPPPCDKNIPAGSCTVPDCTCEGQQCPSGSPGSSSNGFTCLNGKWVENSPAPQVFQSTYTEPPVQAVSNTIETTSQNLNDAIQSVSINNIMCMLPASSCTGWDCNCEGQLCPPGVPGSSARGYTCRNKKWVEN